MNANIKTLQTYERISGEYHQKNKENDAVAKQRAVFQSHIKKGIVYDFGCGTGRDVHAFSQMGYDARGFDGSRAMLEVAKKHYPGNHFYFLDMLEEEWHLDVQPDGIWACASLLHFDQKDFEKVMDRLLHLLKKDGIFYFSVKIKNDLFSEVHEGRFFQYYNKEWLDAFLQNKKPIKILHYEENQNKKDRFASYFLKKNSY